MLQRVTIPSLASIFFILFVSFSYADMPTLSESCILAKFQGDASTYNPLLPGWRTGGGEVATGGRYNPNGWEAALQLDLAQKYRCGYGSGNVCQIVIEAPETRRAAVLLINDNGPLCADSGAGCSHRFERIIDLNEKSMRYLSGGKYGNNTGVLRNVTVTLLSCRLNNFLGPLDPADREAWSGPLLNTPLTELPILPASSNNSSRMPLSSQIFSLFRQPQQGMPVSSGYEAQSSSGATSGGSVTPSGTINEIPGVNASPNSGPSVATLVLQSERAQRGKSIAVAWSTLGMRSDQKCKLSLGELVIAEENGGSRMVAIPISISLGSAEIKLRCTPITGAPIEKRVSFTIE